VLDSSASLMRCMCCCSNYGGCPKDAERVLVGAWVYPEASHGFLNDHPPEDRTPLTVLLSKLSGTRYHLASPRPKA
jgi:hypothetical protein